MTDVKLKPCPFCGGKAKIDEYPSSGTYYGVGCTKCMAASGLHLVGGSKVATDSWNTRVTDSVIEAQEAEIKRLRELGSKIIDIIYSEKKI